MMAVAGRDVARTETPPGPTAAALAAPAVEATGLTKRYGNRLALHDVSLRVDAGECVGIFGPNGAGKSTLLRVLSTLARPTAGQVRCCGLEMPAQASEMRRLVGAVGHQTYLYDDLTVWENLDFYARLYGLRDAGDRIRQVLDLLGLGDRADERVRALSRGLQQRLAIARAILHRPRVLLLDEPDTGLDREGRDRLAGIIGEQVRLGGAVVLTTHAVEFGCQVASRVLFLDRGRLLWERPASGDLVDELERQLRRRA